MNDVVMQIKRTIAVFSALFITVVTSKIRSYQHCGNEMLIQCAKPLSVLTDSGLTFATSKNDLDRMCPDLRDAIRCIHGYTRHCMQLEQQAHFRKLFHGTNAMVNDLCRNETYQEEYLKYAPCMKRVEKQNEICLKDYTAAMQRIESRTSAEESTIQPDVLSYQKRKREVADEGIKSVCCSFQQYVECSTHTMRRACGEDAAQFSRDFLDKMSSTLIRLHCGDYGRSQCGIGLSSASDKFKVSSSLAISILSAIVLYVR